MAILKKEIGKRIKGALMENEDWWHVCYDTDTENFYVEHSWSYTDAYKVSKGTDSGTSIHDIENWTGTGAENVQAAKQSLLNDSKDSR